ncbi:MAG: GntR family transcriptional regulator [Thermoanaerobaculaceae bacterium]|nr:GntR family transcriptional regulator [Thermoanaerobaculaceae bacterium]
MEKLPLKLSQATGVPYYRQIVDQLADLVRSGQLVPGSLLPSVRDLAAQLLVSLITVRNAYDDLENAGLIVRRQGYGTYVADNVAKASHEQTLQEARTVLSDAIGRVRRLGLDTAAILALVHELTVPGGGSDALQ